VNASTASPACFDHRAYLQKRDAEDARKREAELEVALEAERASSAAREGALMAANERLMARVEELSATVSHLQAQVRARTRRGVVRRGSCCRACTPGQRHATADGGQQQQLTSSPPRPPPPIRTRL
jgi:hypothetical protein